MHIPMKAREAGDDSREKGQLLRSIDAQEMCWRRRAL